MLAVHLNLIDSFLLILHHHALGHLTKAIVCLWKLQYHVQQKIYYLLVNAGCMYIGTEVHLVNSYIFGPIVIYGFDSLDWVHWWSTKGGPFS